MTQRKIRRTQERLFAPHHMLLNAARHALEAARTEPKGSFYGQLSAMTFSALALEALSNAIGAAVIKDWKDFDSARPMAKLRILADELGVAYAGDQNPWATARWMMGFRNAIAHAKSEPLETDEIISEREDENRLFDWPQSKLEREITAGNAERAFAAVEEIKRLLLDCIPVDKRLGLEVDGATGSSTLHTD
ncbi:hypothetical protein QCE73_08865 [Caballeronia sp. LZ029]|uniref:hypothetical protein n=1 Tax=Caballeronia sp. LZ029 TaxID=3038564 RepID=UPI002858DABD|nr:hypothetical protein [Caballeronia sp. LZ029]MDR5743264.1 hypothetical protein [Caballeronia sp. LZ029]